MKTNKFHLKAEVLFSFQLNLLYVVVACFSGLLSRKLKRSTNAFRNIYTRALTVQKYSNTLTTHLRHGH